MYITEEKFHNFNWLLNKKSTFFQVQEPPL